MSLLTNENAIGTRRLNAKDSRYSVFFPALNSLRFFAAACVLVYHIEFYKERAGFRSFVPGDLGLQGVYLFFVLSSFLLTYLLLRENSLTGSICLRNFYMRRALRIWPLYLLIVILSFVVVPLTCRLIYHPSEIQTVSDSMPFWGQLFLQFLCMVPNLSLVMYPRVSTGSHTWSLGIEEQFYLIWPLLLKPFRKCPIFACVILGAIAFWVPNIMAPHAFDTCGKPNAIPYCIMVATGRFIMMLTGAIAAVILFKLEKRQVLIRFRPYITISIVGLIVLVCVWQALPFRDTILAILYAALVFSLASVKIGILTESWLVYLGSISYGIYMFHPFVLNCMIKYGDKLEPAVFNAMLYLGALPVAVAISAVSYKYLEEPFLRLKQKCSVIRSDASYLSHRHKARQGE